MNLSETSSLAQSLKKRRQGSAVESGFFFFFFGVRLFNETRMVAVTTREKHAARENSLQPCAAQQA